MKPDFSATNMRLFELVGLVISKLSFLLGHPNCSNAYHEVYEAFVDMVKEQGMTATVVSMLTGHGVEICDPKTGELEFPDGVEVISDIGIRGIVIGYDVHPSDNKTQMVIARRTHNPGGKAVRAQTAKYDMFYPHEITIYADQIAPPAPQPKLTMDTLRQISELEKEIGQLLDILKTEKLFICWSQGEYRNFHDTYKTTMYHTFPSTPDVAIDAARVRIGELIEEKTDEIRKYIPDYVYGEEE